MNRAVKRYGKTWRWLVEQGKQEIKMLNEGVLKRHYNMGENEMTINAKLSDYLSEHDKREATKLVRECLRRGYCLSVFDGEEWAVKYSNDENAVCEALGSTSDDQLRVSEQGKQGETCRYVASFWLVYDNGPRGLLDDYSDNEVANSIAGAVNPDLA